MPTQPCQNLGLTSLSHCCDNTKRCKANQKASVQQNSQDLSKRTNFTDGALPKLSPSTMITNALQRKGVTNIPPLLSCAEQAKGTCSTDPFGTQTAAHAQNQMRDSVCVCALPPNAKTTGCLCREMLALLGS
eukprot:1141434-Amphidinium_carterae.1